MQYLYRRCILYIIQLERSYAKSSRRRVEWSRYVYIVVI